MTSQPQPNQKELAKELAWLRKHPEFDERPATIDQFLGPEYLDLGGTTRESIRTVLRDIFGDEAEQDELLDDGRLAKFGLAIFTGAIGIGKTTVASIILPYMVHWCLCLKDPQKYFGLMPGTRIAFMQMSTSEQQARDVIFSDVKARINHSPWFKSWAADPKFTKQIRLPKNLWIIPGDSSERTFEGYNILGGVVDEIDSHKVTDRQDYAEVGYDTISNRITSRFKNRGFLILIGQMKSTNGFAERKYKEFKRRDDAYAVRLTIWDSMGDDWYRDKAGNVNKFFYDTYRKQIVLKGVGQLIGEDAANIIEVPTMYLPEFENNPEKALKDLAGIPPIVGSPFISLVSRVDECFARWEADFGTEPPVSPDGITADWVRATDSLKRVVHIDVAYAEDGDAMGIAMGHIPRLVEIDGEWKPYIVIDWVMRMIAPAGGEIFLSDMRHLIYDLREDRRFKIVKATLDGFQSQDTIQQFHKRRFEADYLSVDREMLPYEDLRDAIYERRISIPPYMTDYHRGDHNPINIIRKELTELILGTTTVRMKIDHPDGGSKDVSDALAGVTTTLMGERRFRRGPVKYPGESQEKQEKLPAAVGTSAPLSHPAYTGGRGALTAPIPPRTPWR